MPLTAILLQLPNFCLSFSFIPLPLFFFLANTNCDCFPHLFVSLSCLLLRISTLFPAPCCPSWGPEQYLLLQTPLMFTEQMQQDVIMVLKFPSNSPVTHIAANTQAGLTSPAIITVTANRLFAVNKWHGLTGEKFCPSTHTGMFLCSLSCDFMPV